MAGYRLAKAAQDDIAGILAWTNSNFGNAAAQRYGALIVAALRDISARPDRVGSIERTELGADIRSWHLRLSRQRGRTEAGLVQRPRHFLLYRVDSGVVVVGRVLHDVMELAQHSGSGLVWRQQG